MATDGWLILLGCSFLGISASAELHRETRSLTRLQELLREMELLICRRGEPLPEVMASVSSGGRRMNYVRLFQNEDAPKSTDEKLFLRLLCEIREGEVPENAFSRINEELRQKRDHAREQETKYARLYTAGGIGVGLVLCIIFI